MYSTPTQCRQLTVGMTTIVIPDSHAANLNLNTCISNADSDIDGAANAGNYLVPFGSVSSGTTPSKIQYLSAIGAVAKARRALDLGNQGDISEVANEYFNEFLAGLRDLSEAKMDLGTFVATQNITFDNDSNYETWMPLSYNSIKYRSVNLVNSSSTQTYIENRKYETWLISQDKDYEIDYKNGRKRRLDGGAITGSLFCIIYFIILILRY